MANDEEKSDFNRVNVQPILLLLPQEAQIKIYGTWEKKFEEEKRL